MKIEPIDEKHFAPAFMYFKGGAYLVLHYIQAYKHDKELKAEGWEHVLTIEPILFVQNIMNNENYLSEFRNVQEIKTSINQKLKNKMSVSILECLQSADVNLTNNGVLGSMLAKLQVHNATVLLEKGYNIWTEVEPLLEKHGTVEDVPEVDDNEDINQDD